MTTPISLADADSRRQQLTLEIQGIQAQLGDKQRTDESGRRLNANEYWTWKKRAQHALNQKLDELRTLKAWIRENKPTGEFHLRGQDGRLGVAIGHLENLVLILLNLRGEDVEFDHQELQKIEAAHQALLLLSEQMVGSDP